MKDQFTTFEIAKKLDEAGFNLPCIAWFYKDYNGIAQLHLNPNESTCDSDSLLCAAPLWQQAIEWLREEKGIEILYTHEFGFEIWEHSDTKLGEVDDTDCSYSQARSAAIIKALELINH